MEFTIYRDLESIAFVRCQSPIPGTNICAEGTAFSVAHAIDKCRSERIEAEFQIAHPQRAEMLGIAAHPEMEAARVHAWNEALESLMLERLAESPIFNGISIPGLPIKLYLGKVTDRFLALALFTHEGTATATQAVSKNPLLAALKAWSMVGRFPYLLSGFVNCKICGDRLVGKSAHGNAGKIGYYEHGWATRKGSYVPGLKSHCRPYRVLAKQLEPALWDEIQQLFLNEKFAESLLENARQSHLLNPNSREAEKCNQTIFSVDRQLETLAERLASLPETISPTPVYRQMEKLEGHKKEAQNALRKLQSQSVIKDLPASLRDFRVFLMSVAELLNGELSAKTKATVIRALVKRIEVTSEGFNAYFNVGDHYVKSFISDLGNFNLESLGLPDSGEQNSEKNLHVFCSNTCNVGSGSRD